MAKDDRKRGRLRQAIFEFRTGPVRDWRVARALSRRNRHNACFVGVTGSSGKTTTVALLTHILEGAARVQGQSNHNTINPLIKTLSHLRPDLDYVIAELGVGQDSPMQTMATTLKPNVAIITMIGREHYSVFRSREGVAAEKVKLVEALEPGGLAILNAEDNLALGMGERTRAHVVTFGQSDQADYQACDIAARYPDSLSFQLRHPNGEIDLKTRFVGRHFWMAAAAAATTALELGISPEIVAKRVATFETPINRCQPIKFVGGPDIILDAAKAPADTLDLAFEILAEADVPFKRLVLGTISDYPGSSSPVYRSAYRKAREVADQVVFVGPAANRSRASKEDLDTGRFLAFETPQEASEYILGTARKDELLLIKGSANFHLERLALAFQHEVKCWESTCGQGSDCFRCGHFRKIFDRRAIRRHAWIQRLKAGLKVGKEGNWKWQM